MIKDVIIVIVLVSIALGILIYVGNQKKKGSKCIGCPYSEGCSKNCSENNK